MARLWRAFQAHACGICTQTFTTAAALRSHMATEHGIIS